MQYVLRNNGHYRARVHHGIGLIHPHFFWRQLAQPRQFLIDGVRQVHLDSNLAH
jgi:hypothetical protein